MTPALSETTTITDMTRCRPITRMDQEAKELLARKILVGRSAKADFRMASLHDGD
jgi:hypothetical protein